jgi:tetratricopeptide (TPR) repeat protein
MLERSGAAATPAPGASTPIFVATLASLLALILVLLFLDLALARIDRNESSAHAARLFDEGKKLLAAGNAHEAGDRFASAAAIARNNTAYSLGVAEAMMGEGRNEDAEHTLADALGRAENDGAVNLQMARLLERTGRGGEATDYFHRAIFGRWDADSMQRRIDARFELIDALARRKDGSAMLAELLPLEATLPDSTAVRRRLAHLFLEARRHSLSPAAYAPGAGVLEEHAGRSVAEPHGVRECAEAIGQRSELLVWQRVESCDEQRRWRARGTLQH